MKLPSSATFFTFGGRDAKVERVNRKRKELGHDSRFCMPTHSTLMSRNEITRSTNLGGLVQSSLGLGLSVNGILESCDNASLGRPAKHSLGALDIVASRCESGT